ncbi:MAG: autotransporter-associated beta strand repeat-containing protein [Opitutaceae bacterium]|jgi:autotransporter-associated beta strand protein
MKNPRHHASTARISGILAATVLALSASQSAFAADGTWTGTTDNTWQTSTNWNPASFPGATSGFASTDIATFAAAGSGVIDLGGTLNVQSIWIGANGGSAGALTIGDAGDTLNLTSGGNITVGAGVAANEIIGTAGGAINLSTAANSTYSINNYGTGTLTIAAPVTSSQTTGNVSMLTLGGSGNGSVTGVLSGTDTAGNAGLGVVKSGSGTWSLSGANTYTGSTVVRGGTLALDYSADNTPIAASTVTLVNGNLQLVGKSSVSTAATINNLTLGTAGAGQAKTITLDANGGSGVQLTITTLAAANNGGQSILFDLSSSSGNSITVLGGLGLGGVNIGVTNGVLGTGDPSNGGRNPNIIVRNSTGYGFGVLSGGTTGTLGRLSSFTPLTDNTAGSTGTNLKLDYAGTTAGTLTRTANLLFSTLTIDSSGGAIVLDTGSYTNTTGRAVLATGANDVTINGSATLAADLPASVTYNNYLDSNATLAISRAEGSSGIAFNGTGFTNYSGTLSGGASSLLIQGGIVRLSKNRTLQSLNQKNIVSGGGVLEIGADLNGATAGDLSSAIGTANGNIRFIGDSGLSAAGADRVVNFGGAGAALTWGSTNFLTDVDGVTDGGFTLKLSSARSDAKVTIQNSIALGTNTNRVIDVANGGAATDATLSGVLSGSGATLVKTGAGTLSLTAANTYTGGTAINNGSLVAMNNTAFGTGAVTVAANAGLAYVAASDTTLDLGSTLAFSGATTLGGTIGSTGTSAQIATAGNATSTTGALTVNVYGLNGVAPATGTYTLLHGGGASNSLNNFTSINLGTVFNNTNWTITGGSLANSANDITVGITSATALTSAFWTGTSTSGISKVWAASNGSDTSNWSSSSGGTVQGLIPTAVDVTIVGNTVAATNTTLGANMTVKSLTIADTANGLGLNADGNTLTITPATSSAGITMDSGVPDSTIAASVALGANQTWTNNSASALTVSGAISGGANTLTKAGTGVITLAGANSYTGTTTVTAGTLNLTGSLLSSVTTNGTGIFTQSSNGFLGGSTFTQGSSGTSTLAGANTYTGTTTVSAGVLNIQSNTALGTTAGSTSVTSGAALQIQNNITVGVEALTLNGTGIAADGALRNISGTNVWGGDRDAGKHGADQLGRRVADVHESQQHHGN